MSALAAGAPFLHHASPAFPDQLREALSASIDAMRAAGRPVSYVPCADPDEHTSERALRATQGRARVPSDIRTDPELGNPIVFHAGGLVNSVADAAVTRCREVVDELFAQFLGTAIDGFRDCRVIASGHFWYPPGGYQGWHTNERVPGWRAYATFAEQPGRSYFRYEDPRSHAVVTSWDTGWDLRVFETGSERHFWHAVGSRTNRFSFGYRIVR